MTTMMTVMMTMMMMMMMMVGQSVAERCLRSNKAKKICQTLSVKKTSTFDLQTAKVEDMPVLKQLNASRGQFTGHFKPKNIKNCPMLTTLDASHNNLSGIEDWTGMLQNTVEHIDFSYNTIAVLKFSNFPKLRYLNVGYQAVSVSCEISTNPNLRVLRLHANKLNTLPADIFQGCASLTKLDLSKNKFEDIPDLTNLERLQDLDMSSNELDKDILQLPKLNTLCYLNLASNNIKYVSNTFCLENRRLKMLDLSENLIAEIHSDGFEGCPYLRYLDLSSNNLKEIPSNINPWSKLLSMKLMNNRIETFDLQLRKQYQLKRTQRSRELYMKRLGMTYVRTQKNMLLDIRWSSSNYHKLYCDCAILLVLLGLSSSRERYYFDEARPCADGEVAQMKDKTIGQLKSLYNFNDENNFCYIARCPYLRYGEHCQHKCECEGGSCDRLRGCLNRKGFSDNLTALILPILAIILLFAIVTAIAFWFFKHHKTEVKKKRLRRQSARSAGMYRRRSTVVNMGGK